MTADEMLMARIRTPEDGWEPYSHSLQLDESGPQLVTPFDVMVDTVTRTGNGSGNPGGRELVLPEFLGRGVLLGQIWTPEMSKDSEYKLPVVEIEDEAAPTGIVRLWGGRECMWAPLKDPNCRDVLRARERKTPISAYKYFLSLHE